MNPHFILAAVGADAGPVAQIAKTFGANVPALVANSISFLIVAALLKMFAFGPIQAMLAERRSRIAEGLANAEKTKAELANAQATCRELISQAGQQATKIVEEARAAANAVGEQERQRAVADAQNIVAKAREAGAAELALLRSELRKEFGRLVVQAAARSTGDVLSGDQKNRIADDSVRQLSA